MKYRSMLLLVLAVLPGIVSAQLMNQTEPLPGITSSGQPDAEGLSALAEQGYTMVIDLRTESEDRGFDESGTVAQLGMKYVSLPIGGASDVTYENAEALDSFLAEADGPVLIHCASGNRVGALLSLREQLRGADDESALATGLEAGLRSPALREAVEARLEER